MKELSDSEVARAIERRHEELFQQYMTQIEKDKRTK